MKPYTTRKIAALAGISRATLLYYESLGLLSPAARSASGYRLYGEAELKRLRDIRTLRDAGIGMSAIAPILDNRTDRSMLLLKQRLLELDQEIGALRTQQIMLARILAQESLQTAHSITDKAAWVVLMREAGFTETDMRRWHAEFEATAPDTHARFLASLGLSEKEVAEIRDWCTAGT